LHTKLIEDKDTGNSAEFTTVKFNVFKHATQSHSFLNTMKNKNEEIAESRLSYHLVKMKSSAQWCARGNELHFYGRV